MASKTVKINEKSNIIHFYTKSASLTHFPSDLVWQNKTKNIYLLEIDRAIKQKKWRDWLNICFGVINPINLGYSIK